MEFQGFVADIFVAIFGGLLHFFYKKVVDRQQQKKLEKQYPVAGSYISKYEDEEDGVTVWRSAQLDLKQRGDKVTGTTCYGKTTWTIDAHILGGYLIGHYSAESNFNDGIGTFFLRISNDEKMDGIWSGYDDQNNKVTSGRYIFIRKLNVEIKPITKRDIPSVLNIAEKQLGGSYVDEASLVGEGIHGFYAITNDRVVGFCVGKIIPAEKFLEKYSFLKGRGKKSIGAAETVGFLASIAVDADYKGRGIGEDLSRCCAEHLVADGAQLLAATAWKSSKGVHVEGLVRLHGFEKIIEIPLFWHEDSLKHNFHCPECGAPPCNCTAVLYVKHIAGQSHCTKHLV